MHKWRKSEEPAFESAFTRKVTPHTPSMCHGVKTGTNWPGILDINSLAPDPFSPPLLPVNMTNQALPPAGAKIPRTENQAGPWDPLISPCSLVGLTSERQGKMKRDRLAREPYGHWENYFNHGVGDLENIVSTI
ncbi:hypothetical protein PRIPAC_90990 [Pristionchus pacificus]|uniref:Uncharacterized protein n=1 Tax=Pristionchus pacificus TaxID=54126 RepID=A0A2A6CW74_PRIPA|nr:hypothetical protein PRIPAC_90990 [Pristionchus pacificus]|eukprot:PDM82409.1 hypothetical protein PRIPAC_36802 [Pristionchus pacificus]